MQSVRVHSTQTAFSIFPDFVNAYPKIRVRKTTKQGHLLFEFA